MILNNKKNKFTVLLLLLIMSSSQVYSVSRRVANGITGCVALTYVAGMCGLVNKIDSDAGIFCCIAAGVLLTSFTHSVLDRTTPERLLDRVELIIKKLNSYKFVKVCFTQEAQFFDAVYDVYLMEDLPLIAAYKTLLELVSLSHIARALINQSSTYARRDKCLQERCEMLCCMSNKLHRNIIQAIKRIRSHKDYLPQLRVYKQFVAKEKSLFALI